MHAEKIIEIKKLGIRPTIDIEVANDNHIFYANGVVAANSHAVLYAETSYLCMWVKCHFPLHFFCSWLSMANDKQKPLEEVAELIQDARLYDINILPPSMFLGNDNFVIEGGDIRFGLGNIKGVGFSKVEKTFNTVSIIETECQKKLSEMAWYELLIFLLPQLHKSAINNIISCGALSKFGMQRKEMLFEYQRASMLTDREVAWIKKQNFNNITDAFEGLIKSGIPNKKRVETIRSVHILLKNRPEALVDSIDWVSGVEHGLLGVSISCSKLDGCDTSGVNCSCETFAKTELKSIIMALQIDRVAEWRAKVENSKPMCFITAHDNTGSIEISVGSKQYDENGFLLFSGNTVIFSGYKNKGGKFAVNKVTQI